MSIKEEIEKLVKPVIEKNSCKLMSVKIGRQKKGVILIITIDKEGGVSVEDCGKISRKIEKILDERNLIKERYFLIVSSPGIK